MSFKFVQHVPTFVEGHTPFVLTLENTEELLKHPYITRCKEQKDFFQFSQIQEDNGCTTLMSETKEGRSWWVEGTAFINDLGLPKWVPNE